MIKGNTIYFGYGDVATGAEGYYITLQNIKPPQECGTNIIGRKDIELLDEKLLIKITYKDGVRLLNDLVNITHDSAIIQCKDSILDFTNFNQNSVNAVKRAVKCILKNYLKVMVC